jgi:hypothetical protein
MQNCCFGFEQHRGRWAVFGDFSPRRARSKVINSLMAESPTIQKLQNILGVDIGILATHVLRARKTGKRS